MISHCVWLIVFTLQVARAHTECLDLLASGTVKQECLPILISKLLGYVVVTAAACLKVPQIVKILRRESVAGISSVSCYIEVMILTMNTAYSYHFAQPFSTYGETVVILVQSFLICLLLWTYGNYSFQHKAAAIGIYLAGWSLPLLGEFFPEGAWPLVPVLSAVGIVVARGSQIVTNYRNQSTGELALATTLLLTVGLLARVYTSVVEVQDYLQTTKFAIAFVLTLVLLIQFHLYWGMTIKEKKS